MPPRTPTMGGFDLKGQFTTATVAAVMARNAEVRPQPARTPTKVLGQFDPRPVFANASVHALSPIRPATISAMTNRTAPPMATMIRPSIRISAWPRISSTVEISGESGPGCGHNCDHVARARPSACRTMRGTKLCDEQISPMPGARTRCASRHEQKFSAAEAAVGSRAPIREPREEIPSLRVRRAAGEFQSSRELTNGYA